MSTLGSLSLSDGTSTRTFTPVTKSDGVSVWTDFAVSSPELRPQITFSVTQPKAVSGVGRVKLKVTFSYLAADGKTVRTAFINTEAVIPKDMVEADRAMLRELTKASLSAGMPFGLGVQRYEDTF